MLGAIKHGLGNLLNFKGRDARQTFWYYVLFIYILATAVTLLMMIPAMVTMFSDIVDVAKSGASKEVTDQAMSASMAGLFSNMTGMTMVLGVAYVALLAASLVRRLHDSDKPGWWALGPGLLQLISVGMIPAQMNSMTEVMKNPEAAANPTAMIAGQGAAGLIAWVAIGLIIWFGVCKSTDGPNQYGDAPVRF